MLPTPPSTIFSLVEEDGKTLDGFLQRCLGASLPPATPQRPTAAMPVTRARTHQPAEQVVTEPTVVSDPYQVSAPTPNLLATPFLVSVQGRPSKCGPMRPGNIKDARAEPLPNLLECSGPEAIRWCYPTARARRASGNGHAFWFRTCGCHHSRRRSGLGRRDGLTASLKAPRYCSDGPSSSCSDLPSFGTHFGFCYLVGPSHRGPLWFVVPLALFPVGFCSPERVCMADALRDDRFHVGRRFCCTRGPRREFWIGSTERTTATSVAEGCGLVLSS